ncbi:MAG: PilZ domain-containing protein [Rhizobiaceae bacterium]|nr:PilZ domain-containing protein [Rhizobiaceae bacterium]
MSSMDLATLGPHERRAFERVKVALRGRFMLEDRSEHPCQVYDMSPGNIALIADRIGEPGEKVIAYLEHVGRIEGVVTRTFEGGFAMTVLASERKREKLSVQLSWLVARQKLGLAEDRRHDRVAPRNPFTSLRMDDGRSYECRIIDLSLSGAGIEIDVRPAIGSQVTLGTMRGTVVRHFEEGIAIEFASLHDQEELDQQFSS